MSRRWFIFTTLLMTYLTWNMPSAAAQGLRLSERNPKLDESRL